MEKQAPFADLCIYVQKHWKGTRTLSACKSAFSHSELLQMKYIILTPLAFIQVTSPACSLLSHKSRAMQLKANPFLGEPGEPWPDSAMSRDTAPAAPEGHPSQECTGTELLAHFHAPITLSTHQGSFFTPLPAPFNFCLSTCVAAFVTSKPLQGSS